MMNKIARITKIKNCPSFVDFRPSTDLPEFKKYNLIYGWNGSGKTSFSRVLRSFELGENYFSHPERLPEFEFKLKNEDSINQNDLTAFTNIRVFNKDFIDESVFGSGGPKTIFFLGKESKEDKEKITDIENELRDLIKDRDSKKELLKKDKSIKDRLLSEKAKDIKNVLTTSRVDKYRNYERPNLEQAIQNNSDILKNPDNFKLVENRIAALQKAIQQTTKPTINSLSKPSFDMSDIVSKVKDILHKTVTSQVIEALKSDEIVSKWVESGLAIHKKRDLTDCAFCNQSIPGDRLTDLENHFNEDYQKLMEFLRQLKDKCSARKIDISFPDASNFYDDLVDEYRSKQKEAISSIKIFNQRLEYIISVLEQKELNPFSKFSLKDLPPIEGTPFQEINDIITRHNEKSKDFDGQLEKNKSTIEMHYIAEFVDEMYNELLRGIKMLENEYTSLVITVGEKEKEILRLKKSLVSHYIPAQQINKDLERFLGRSDIQLSSDDKQEGYQISRNGEAAENLSEGERTALAIVYFLTKINEEGFDLKNSVVVIDDPVSSLDSNSIFQAFSFIKESIKHAGQIFILTHHFDFFRQVKNWFFYPRNKKDSECFMIICKEKDAIRKSAIIKIDKLLIDYESEYHFLFSILYKFAIEGEQSLEKMYSLPNIARKFLESFLAFRVPLLSRNNKPSIYYRLDHICLVDPKKKERIRRFVDTHSHPRYESGVQDFDMTILGETPDILNDLLELVQKEDKRHYDFLVESVTAN